MAAMESCDACGFDYLTVTPERIADTLRHYGRVLDQWLRLGDDGTPEWTAALTTQPSAEVWSAQDYAGHLLIVARMQHQRVSLATAASTSEPPDFVPVPVDEHTAEARFNERDVATLRGELATAIDALADLYDSLDDTLLERTGNYHWPVRAERTMTWVGRHTIHELRHHGGDIVSSISAAEPFGPNMLADSHVSLLAWLEFHRATLAATWVGASDDTLRARPVTTSALSLIGLVRHLTVVEQYWFEEIWMGLDVDDLYVTDADPDGDFNDTLDADVDQAFAAWRRQCEKSRRIVSDVASIDEIAARPRHERQVNLRWILTHMIEEYAQHNGHADLLRELADGTTNA